MRIGKTYRRDPSRRDGIAFKMSRYVRVFPRSCYMEEDVIWCSRSVLKCAALCGASDCRTSVRFYIRIPISAVYFDSLVTLPDCPPAY